ncbi:MAG: YceI family protein [bacterium]|nr:YceI family protein [bacterium]MCP5067504.1 YceI family protein [bacterium]
MRLRSAILGAIGLLLILPVGAAGEDEIFEPTDHCVAYETIKDMWFVVDTRIVGKSCEVTAALAVNASGGAPRVSVSVPIESLDSKNRFRNGAVADLLGVEAQPDLLFVSAPLDAEGLREALPSGHFTLPGTLSFGGREYPVEFPVELSSDGDRHYASGMLDSTFAAFEVEVPTIAGGLIARPQEGLGLAFQLELERVSGLEAWAEQAGLRLSGAE